MIINFTEFVVENFSEYDGSLGEYISGLAEKDVRVSEIVASYTKDVDQSVDISNAVEILSDTVKISLLKSVENHINGVEAELKVSTSSVDESPEEALEESFGSKGVFTSFLKSLTALGFKDNVVSRDTKSNFLFMFRFVGANGVDVKQVFKRFKSLQEVTIDEEKRLSLYYGVRTDGMLEYGIYIDDMEPVGEFKLKRREFNNYKVSKLKSLSGFKKSMVELDYEDLVTMLKLKQVMSEFDPGQVQSKMQPEINNRIMTFGYYGYGTWSAGNISPQDLEDVKNNVKEHLSKYKWTKNCLMAVDARNFWIYINIKLK